MYASVFFLVFNRHRYPFNIFRIRKAQISKKHNSPTFASFIKSRINTLQNNVWRGTKINLGYLAKMKAASACDFVPIKYPICASRL